MSNIKALEPHFSFNRYIVECKFYPSDDLFPSDNRFNRYIVECKLCYWL